MSIGYIAYKGIIMKIILSFLVFMFVIPVYADAAGVTKISSETTLKAIKLYRANPTARDAVGALSIVLDFADQSQNVSVDIKQDYFPWSLGKISPEFESKFIGAFVAGNVEYQLINGVNKNTPSEGIKLVLLTYEKLRDMKVFPVDKEFEKWLSWNKKGDLSKKLKI